mmetsp:Transcript_67623/g.195755  ORF Transcript_67623/g.195755 Transcript_67623/m.195755 type:complete len:299 (+) Transcript_67623:447-1343(+)
MLEGLPRLDHCTAVLSVGGSRQGEFPPNQHLQSPLAEQAPGKRCASEVVVQKMDLVYDLLGDEGLEEAISHPGPPRRSDGYIHRVAIVVSFADRASALCAKSTPGPVRILHQAPILEVEDVREVDESLLLPRCVIYQEHSRLIHRHIVFEELVLPIVDLLHKGSGSTASPQAQADWVAGARPREREHLGHVARNDVSMRQLLAAELPQLLARPLLQHARPNVVDPVLAADLEVGAEGVGGVLNVVLECAQGAQQADVADDVRVTRCRLDVRGELLPHLAKQLHLLGRGQAVGEAVQKT